MRFISKKKTLIGILTLIYLTGTASLQDGDSIVMFSPWKYCQNISAASNVSTWTEDVIAAILADPDYDNCEFCNVLDINLLPQLLTQNSVSFGLMINKGHLFKIIFRSIEQCFTLCSMFLLVFALREIFCGIIAVT